MRRLGIVQAGQSCHCAGFYASITVAALPRALPATALQHLATTQRLLRELQGHLRAVAGERDAALAQLQHVDGKLRAAAAREAAAEEQEVGVCAGA